MLSKPKACQIPTSTGCILTRHHESKRRRDGETRYTFLFSADQTQTPSVSFTYINNMPTAHFVINDTIYTLVGNLAKVTRESFSSVEKSQGRQPVGVQNTTCGQTDCDSSQKGQGNSTAGEHQDHLVSIQKTQASGSQSSGVTCLEAPRCCWAFYRGQGGTLSSTD